MKAFKLLMALCFTSLLIGCSSSSGGGGSTTSSSSSGGTSSSSSSSGGPVTGTPFAGLPLDVEFILPRNEFFGGQSNQSGSVPYEVVGDFLAISDDAESPFYKVFSAGSRIRMANTTGIRFGNAYWGAGVVSTSSTTPGIAPEGDIDLSLPYTITIEIANPPATGGQFQVDVDNSTSGAANSIHGSASQLVNITDPEVGTLEINVPGDVVMTPTGGSPTVIGTISGHVGTSNSFVKFRCPGNCGANNDHNIPDGFTDADAPELPANLSIELSSIVIEYQDGGVLQPPLTPFVAPTLTADDQEIGVVANIMGNATSYDIGWSTTDDSGTIGGNVIEGTVADVGDPPVSRVTGTITGLTNGQLYYVFVRASNAAGDSDWGPSASSTPVGDPPAAPIAPPMLTAGNELITVSWDAVATADAYDVGWSTTDDAGTIAPADVIMDVVTTGTTITGLTNGQLYYVFVRAKNAAGSSAYGPSASATPEAPAAGPLLTEDFAATTGDASATDFFTLAYKAQTNDSTMPMYFLEGGGSGMNFNGSSVSLGSSSRFTIGQKLVPGTPPTDPGDTGAGGHNALVGPLAGDLDLSQPWRIRFNIANANAGTFQVYVDNNTTSNSNSIHGSASRPFSQNLTTTAIPDGPFQVESLVGTAGSFIQLRCDSGCSGVTISNLVIEYQ